MQGNAVIGQSGGPTVVINQSLVGCIEGLRKNLSRFDWEPTTRGDLGALVHYYSSYRAVE